MSGFRAQSDEVPHGVRVLAVGRGVPLLGVNEGRKENGVPDEEDGGVIADEVPVSFLRVELHSKASWVTSSVCATALAANLKKEQTRKLYQKA